MSSIYIAFKTLQAFDHYVRVDQGARFRQLEGKEMPLLADAYRGEEEGFRSHLGASLIGRECDRQLWYMFHWAKELKFEGRMVRLFNRGHLEEGRFIALLKTIGCEVWTQTTDGTQFRISDHGGHFGGSLDSVARGVPDIEPDQFALTEFKTHGLKSFNKLAGTNWDEFMDTLLNPKLPRVNFSGAGVREAKFEHWIQMQIYMRKQRLAVGLYLAVCKDNDAIYAEMVPLDSMAADWQTERAGRIIRIETPPAKIAKTAGDYRCKFCDFVDVCHKGEKLARNCRTCKHSEVNIETGGWNCSNPICTDGGQHELRMDKALQLTGCSHYEARTL